MGRMDELIEIRRNMGTSMAISDMELQLAMWRYWMIRHVPMGCMWVQDL